MSLLMDALRKAEQQKQKLAGQGQPGSGVPFPEPATGLALEPISMQGSPSQVPPQTPEPGTIPVAPPNGRLPDLPTRLEDLDEQFMAHAAQPPLKPQPAPIAPPPPPTPATKAKLEASPEAARKLFEAKQPVAPQNKRNFAIVVGIATLITGGGIGGYFWWELQPKGSMVAGNSPRPPGPVSAPAVPPPPMATPASASPQQQPTLAANAAVPPVPTLAPPQPPAPDEDKPGVPVSRQMRSPAAPLPVTPESPVRVSSAPKKVDPSLEMAYQAFNRGDVDLAQANWKKALNKDPRNSDALHGMAAIALQNQQYAQAADYYLKALENDPKDAQAVAGLLALKAPADILQAESRLKTLLAEQPDSPQLNFAIGNLFSRSARWADAQQAYFKAHTGDPANPDYLFNLAVSLDQLHQSRLAAQYYQQALSAASGQPAGFDAAQITTRLKALQSGMQP